MYKKATKSNIDTEKDNPEWAMHSHEKLIRLDKRASKRIWERRRAERVLKAAQHGLSHIDAANYYGGRIEMMLRKKQTGQGQPTKSRR